MTDLTSDSYCWQAGQRMTSHRARLCCPLSLLDWMTAASRAGRAIGPQVSPACKQRRWRWPVDDHCRNEGARTHGGNGEWRD